MGIISTIKSLLGGGDDGGSPVAVEREPAAASERAVKGLDDGVDHRLPDDGTDDAESTDTATDAGEPVDAVKGIGPAYAERLEAAGVETVADLAATDPEALAETTGLGAGRVSGWIERAESRTR